MTNDPSNTESAPVKNPREPNDDGFVVGTAGRDEDPNATTDWDHPDDPQHRKGTDEDSQPPPNGTPGIDIVPGPDNDGAD
ncbi:hypothetical protein A462_28345 [Pseudomonas sp. Ag1]|jgi:hypothetical protein|uniref:hypothetical protein n=1 Tax=Pseudomonas sp. Ag1 TaxID=1197727 RepID=UPI000272CECD|nr:hypothetical protein [Pseudomonas sp. Ag1]EJF68218.1 hypothetical protein A462_28345 [Pseudomonas sp. Ag1]